MKIELKKISINTRMSEETTCFTADLYVDGKLVAIAMNHGHGGCTNIRVYGSNAAEFEVNAPILEKAKVWARENSEEKPYNVHPSAYLEDYVDDIIWQEDLRKQRASMEKKLAKECDKAICYGKRTDNGLEYATRFWKGYTLAQVLASPKGPQLVRDCIAKVKSELKEGEVIFNTNIPAEYLA